MSSINAYSTSSVLVILALALQFQASYGADPLFHFCSTPENFTANSPYESNQNQLTTFLSYHAPEPGFALGSFGQDPDTVYGLALCRGDASAADCKSCLVDARTEILNRCPYNKASIIWYDYCFLKYSNKHFFGSIDNQNKFYMWNVQSVSDPSYFNERTKELLSQLSEKGYVTPKLYATREMELKESEKLYGLVQCTRDLSSVDCKKCLDGIIGEILGCCDGKRGGRVVSGSCNFRYELYPFVNA